MERSGNSGRKREHNPNSFQVRFGILVRRYRELAGLTQMDVARLVFKDETKTTRVSDVERGRHEPRPQTIADYRAALAIPESEIDDLRRSLALDHNLVAVIKNEFDITADGLLEGLCLRFLSQNPSSPREELKAFLRAKAKDWKILEERITALKDLDERISNQSAAARYALARGNFSEAEEILSAAEEIQQKERTLTEVRKQSEIRATRAEAALLKGDQNQALEHFKAAADMYSPFDPLEGAQLRRKHYVALFQHGLQFPGPALAHAATLAKINLAAYEDPIHAQERGKTLNNLAIFLQNQGAITDGPRGSDLLRQAVEVYRSALEIRTRDTMPDDWATTQNNLGTALNDQGLRKGGLEGANLLAQAVGAYRDSLQVRTHDTMPTQWAKTQNNLGLALQIQGTWTGEAEGIELLAQSVAAYRDSLRVRTRDAMPADWAVSQTNLGIALKELGIRTDGADGADLLEQAVEAHRNALEVCTRQAMPAQWALTKHNLGVALQEQGFRTEGMEGANLLTQAAEEYRSALEVNTRDDMPIRWAKTQINLGLVTEATADRLQATERNGHLKQALTYLDAALKVFDPDTSSHDFQKCSSARDRIATKMTGTWEETEKKAETRR